MMNTASVQQVPSAERPERPATVMNWRRHVVERWRALPPASRSPHVLCTAGLILAAVLLAAFHQVLVQAVQRAEARNMAWANRAYAMARCASLPQPEWRESCRTRAMAGVVPPEPPLGGERIARLD